MNDLLNIGGIFGVAVVFVLGRIFTIIEHETALLTAEPRHVVTLSLFNHVRSFPVRGESRYPHWGEHIGSRAQKLLWHPRELLTPQMIRTTLAVRDGRQW